MIVKTENKNENDNLAITSMGMGLIFPETPDDKDADGINDKTGMKIVYPPQSVIDPPAPEPKPEPETPKPVIDPERHIEKHLVEDDVHAKVENVVNQIPGLLKDLRDLVGVKVKPLKPVIDPVIDAEEIRMKKVLKLYKKNNKRIDNYDKLLQNKLEVKQKEYDGKSYRLGRLKRSLNKKYDLRIKNNRPYNHTN